MTHTRKPATTPHRYRIRIGKRLWVSDIRLTSRGRIAHVALTSDRHFAVVIESNTPKWMASKFDQAARNAFDVELGVAWADFHFVDAGR